MDELEKALAVLMGHTNRDEVHTLVQEKGRELWQHIFNAGHSTATQQSKKDREKWDADKVTLQGEIKTLKDKVKEIEGKSPEVASIRQQYETEIKKLQDQIAERDQQETERRRSETITSHRNDLISKLTALKVNPAFARTLVFDPDVAGRLVIAESGELQVMQKGTNIPIITANGKSALDVLAEELRSGVPNDLIVASGDRGTGRRADGTPAGAEPNFYDKIRKDVKAREEAATPRTGREGASRLGMPVER
jgi:hypothetical protein